MEQALIGPKQICPHCGHEFSSLLILSGLALYSFCPKCDQDFDDIMATLVPICTTCEFVDRDTDKRKMCTLDKSPKFGQEVNFTDVCDFHERKTLDEQLDLGV